MNFTYIVLFDVIFFLFHSRNSAFNCLLVQYNSFSDHKSCTWHMSMQSWLFMNMAFLFKVIRDLICYITIFICPFDFELLDLYLKKLLSITMWPTHWALHDYPSRASDFISIYVQIMFPILRFLSMFLFVFVSTSVLKISMFP